MYEYIYQDDSRTTIVQYEWKCLGEDNDPSVLCISKFKDHGRLELLPIIYIIYSYEYLESDLIKLCHAIFIHSLGQPLIARSHSKVHRSRGNPKEIPT
jgi:hypothetical protein